MYGFLWESTIIDAKAPPRRVLVKAGKHLRMHTSQHTSSAAQAGSMEQ